MSEQVDQLILSELRDLRVTQGDMRVTLARVDERTNDLDERMQRLESTIEGESTARSMSPRRGRHRDAGLVISSTTVVALLTWAAQHFLAGPK